MYTPCTAGKRSPSSPLPITVGTMKLVIPLLKLKLRLYIPLVEVLYRD